ncbi:TauD/TfdA family dioxygenase [Allokutzneria sp. A3M-2-11 16]|uniref:TauD/TfdA dioxygenase family protein n=1 Tax=Allokutzneria sp. A3M-2-11 16 TaxID=2962043 RepID=UPI0020B6588D|nr:TauD/TfdA family dioxygenase [Allokutzneria sp. A3M-2-11 16]MCP3797664.1 TauD/TfdA family dioxygenase [Allokutzneria sp. A3M-2-11 16]
MSLAQQQKIGSFGVLVQAGAPGTNPTTLAPEALLALAREHHILVLRGFRDFTNAEDLTAWCGTLGEVMMWPFGAVLELVETDAPTDHIFDHSYVPLHWDGMYKPMIPEFQVFQCVSAPGAGNGGRTTFSDSSAVLASADPATVERWRDITVTYRIQNKVHYGGKAVSPLVVPHPTTGVPTMRYNEPPLADDSAFLNRPSHSFDGVASEDVHALLEELQKALYDPRHYYAHNWVDGDLVITDNYTLLHGREAFTHRAPRHLRRVHVLGDPPFRNPAL